MSVQHIGAGAYLTQTVTSNETLLADDGPSVTTITDTGGFFTFGINFDASVSNTQVGDLSGHGFTIQAVNNGGAAVQILGSNDTLEGNILFANDPRVNGNGADLITGGGANSLLIDGNTFTGSGFALAYVNGALDGLASSQNVDFVNNTFTGTATAGVDLSYDAASGNISGNSFSGSGAGAIFLGHVSKALADFFNQNFGTSYIPEAGTITLTNNDFTHWSGADVLTFDASYTFGNGGAGHTFTSTIDASGKETDTLTGFTSGDQIALEPGITATSVQQHGKTEVDVSLSDGDQLVFQGNGIKAKDVAAALGVDTHVDNGNHNGFDHSQHLGYIR